MKRRADSFWSRLSPSGKDLFFYGTLSAIAMTAILVARFLTERSVFKKLVTGELTEYDVVLYTIRQIRRRISNDESYILNPLKLKMVNDALDVAKMRCRTLDQLESYLNVIEVHRIKEIFKRAMLERAKLNAEKQAKKDHALRRLYCK